MSNKYTTERISHYKASVNENGFEKGCVDHIVDNWYNSDGKIYKSIVNYVDGTYIQIHTLYDDKGQIASIIRKDIQGEFVNSTIFRYDEAGHIMKKLFYSYDYQMLEEEDDEEDIQKNDGLKLSGWDEYQYNADFSSATILRFDFDEHPQLHSTRTESYDSNGELVEQVEHFHGNDNLSGHTHICKDETGTKIVTTEGTSFKGCCFDDENPEYENYKTQEFYNPNGERYKVIYYREGIETEYHEYRYEYDEQGRVLRGLESNRNTIETIVEHEYDLNLNACSDEPENKFQLQIGTLKKILNTVLLLLSLSIVGY